MERRETILVAGADGQLGQALRAEQPHQQGAVLRGAGDEALQRLARRRRRDALAQGALRRAAHRPLYDVGYILKMVIESLARDAAGLDQILDRYAVYAALPCHRAEFIRYELFCVGLHG